MASGILNISKPSGPTSFGVVRSVRRFPGVSKVGHGGTLDPAAEGVLPILVNGATRLSDFVHAWPKTYLATVVFGAVSDTGDREGQITPSGDARLVNRERIEAALPAFIGWIDQVPPAYSALKQGGESLYRKARRGEAVEVGARRVEIAAITLVDYDPDRAAARLEIRSGRGMYVRSLAKDLGAALGCGAYLGSLTRLAVGPLRLDTAMPVARLLELGTDWPSALLPMDLPIRDWPSVTLAPPEVAAVMRGQAIAAPAPAAGRYRLLDTDGDLVAWGEVIGQRLQPHAVFRG